MSEMLIPVVVSAAWGIGYLTGVCVTKKEYRKYIESIKKDYKQKFHNMLKEHSEDLTNQFYKKLSEQGITFERTLMLAAKDCGNCVNKGKCAIYDNFNIDFCSDWRE